MIFIDLMLSRNTKSI